jgi:3D (Asp-Asp-Asp) domain-containing protein
MQYLVAGLVIGLNLLSSAFAANIEQIDLQKLPNIRPTTYYTPSEASISCKGKYGSRYYKANETQNLMTPEGHYIATVCKRFGSVLLMEGSGILKSRGAGTIAVNYAGTVKGTVRYSILDRCKYGHGVRAALCLLPYHTIAADNKVHKINSIVYIPAAKGIRLPDGSIHDGTFIVRDTGGAFRNAGPQRVDLFVGTAFDYDNVFQKAGFEKTKSFKAYRVKGQSADRVRENLRAKFRTLY